MIIKKCVFSRLFFLPKKEVQGIIIFMDPVELLTARVRTRIFSYSCMVCKCSVGIWTFCQFSEMAWREGSGDFQKQ